MNAFDEAISPALGALLAPSTADGALGLLRQKAAARFQALGLPGTTLENWKYTSLAPLMRTALVVADSSACAAFGPEALASLPATAAGNHRLVIVNGHLRLDLSTLGALPAGLRVQALSEPGASAALAVLDEAADDNTALTLLNAALMHDGVLIELAADTVLDTPLHIMLVGSAGQLLRSPRLVFKLGRHARLGVIEEYLGAADDQGLTNTVCNVRLGDGAELIHHRLQNEAPGANHLGRIDVCVGRDARYVSDSVVFGGTLTRLDIDVRLSERGASCRLNGLFVGDGEQHIDHHTRVDHLVGDTHSEERYRGILDGRSRGVFNGKVVVHRDAQLITARQASNNLLLSRTAEIDTKPELEIYADDVACAHGATVGELDQAALFYLRSRGVPEAEARALLTFAFASAIVNDMPLAGLRRWVEQRFLGHTRYSDLIHELELP